MGCYSSGFDCFDCYREPTPLDRLRNRIGYQASTTRLRRRSADVAGVFLAGASLAELANALGVHVDLIEDAVRWELKRRKGNSNG